MPSVEQHPAGSFCWFELGTSDSSAAKEFYQSLFDWTSEDFPMGPGGVYTMFSLEGRHVGACYALNPQQTAEGVPPNWMIYVSVEDADATAEKAGQLGANVYMPAFDVQEHGRMTVMADPTGAVFSIWQAKQNPGVGLTGVEGTVCWADLNTSNTGAAKEFYSSLFGWSIKPSEKDSSGYLHIYNGETGIGGMPSSEQLPPHTPPHWLIYFLVSDCAGAQKKAEALGASALMPTIEIPAVGSMAILKDPQGAVFAFYQSAAPKAAL